MSDISTLVLYTGPQTLLACVGQDPLAQMSSLYTVIIFNIQDVHILFRGFLQAKMHYI